MRHAAIPTMRFRVSGYQSWKVKAAMGCSLGCSTGLIAIQQRPETWRSVAISRGNASFLILRRSILPIEGVKSENRNVEAVEALLDDVSNLAATVCQRPTRPPARSSFYFVSNNTLCALRSPQHYRLFALWLILAWQTTCCTPGGMLSAQDNRAVARAAGYFRLSST